MVNKTNDDQSKRVILGSFEEVEFPDFNNYKVTAKIDTGAYSGALHCTKIFVDKSKRKHVLHFSPFDHPEVEMKSRNFRKRTVTSSNGSTQERFIIKTNVTIQGKTYPINISLADRSVMKWDVLIGRRFLRKHNFLVDVNKH